MSVKERYQYLMDNVQKTLRSHLRSQETLTVILVSKYATLSQIQEAFDAGCRDFGENKVQDALSKISSFSKEIRWHFIGTLQSNKVNKVVGVFDTIQSVDSYELAKKIHERALYLGITQKVFLQVNTSEEVSKHGFSLQNVFQHIDDLVKLSHLKWVGLMTISALDFSQKKPQRCFEELSSLREKIWEHLQDTTDFRLLSMGMSQDYQEAIGCGSNIIRVGSAVFEE